MGFLGLTHVGAAIVVTASIAGCTTMPTPTIVVETGLSTPSPQSPSLPTPTVAPTAAPTIAAFQLPNPGGTCSSSQFVLTGAQAGFAFSAADYRHVYFTQSLVNHGPTCVLKAPKVIGLAPNDGVYQAVDATDMGKYIAPRSFSIRAGQAFSIEFSISWWVGATDGNGNQVLSPPPCSGAVRDVVRVAFPVGSGAILIDLNAVIGAAGSIPWHEVCASPTHLFFDVILA